MPRRRDEPLLKEIGARVRRLRKERRLTQEQLAASAGVQVETISRCETADTAMSLANLSRVAQIFGVTLGDIVDSSRSLPAPVETQEGLEVARIYESMVPSARGVALRFLRDLAATWPAEPATPAGTAASAPEPLVAVDSPAAPIDPAPTAPEGDTDPQPG